MWAVVWCWCVAGTVMYPPHTSWFWVFRNIGYRHNSLLTVLSSGYSHNGNHFWLVEGRYKRGRWSGADVWQVLWCTLHTIQRCSQAVVLIQVDKQRSVQLHSFSTAHSWRPQTTPNMALQSPLPQHTSSVPNVLDTALLGRMCKNIRAVQEEIKRGRPSAVYAAACSCNDMYKSIHCDILKPGQIGKIRKWSCREETTTRNLPSQSKSRPRSLPNYGHHRGWERSST